MVHLTTALLHASRFREREHKLPFNAPKSKRGRRDQRVGDALYLSRLQNAPSRLSKKAGVIWCFYRSVWSEEQENLAQALTQVRQRHRRTLPTAVHRPKPLCMINHANSGYTAHRSTGTKQGQNHSSWHLMYTTGNAFCLYKMPKRIYTQTNTQASKLATQLTTPKSTENLFSRRPKKKIYRKQTFFFGGGGGWFGDLCHLLVYLIFSNQLMRPFTQW